MPFDIIVNAMPAETRIAVLEDGLLTEFWMDRETTRASVGDIYKGRVEKVLPGLQAAFVDIGTGKSGFLSLDDVAFDPADFDDDDGGKAKRPRRLEQLLKAGQEILVQVTKEPISAKGPRLTAQVSLPGRLCVLVPAESGIGVSRRIENREERRRLKEAVRGLLPPGCGAIVRTAAQGEPDKKLKVDLSWLAKAWDGVAGAAKKVRAPARVHAQPPLVIGLLQDLASYDIKRVVVDDKGMQKLLADQLGKTDPDLRRKLQLHKGDRPVFEAYDVEGQLEKAVQRKVWLKGGGHLTIEQTEALAAIDVNSGKFVGRSNPEDTVFKVNLVAAREVARQVRLRDMGGIIVIDFIDMEKRSHRQAVVDEFKKALASDRSRPKVYDISPLGLVEMSRKRVRPSLWQSLSQECPACGGTGRVLSPLTMALKLERWLAGRGEGLKRRKIQIAVNPAFLDHLRGDGAHVISNLRRQQRTEVYLVADKQLPMSEFAVTDLDGGQLLTDQ